jgi:hypothetical protein
VARGDGNDKLILKSRSLPEDLPCGLKNEDIKNINPYPANV